MSGRTRLTVTAAIATLLASVVLRPLFTDLDYLLPVLGAVTVVGLVSETCRRLVMPTVMSPIASLLALVAYLVAVFAHGTAVLGVLPGRDARAHLRHLVNVGLDDVNKLAPPVPMHTGLLLLTTAGVGVIAILVDFIAVGLRKAAVAGMPMFALFVIPAAVAPKGIGAMPFVVAASGYLALLVADGRERLGRWGKPLGAGRRSGEGPALRVDVAETSPLARVGRRIAAASLGLAVLVPGVTPGVDDRPFGNNGNGSGKGDGSSSVTAINPITQLRRQLTSKDDTKVLRYTANSANAGYLRMTTLDNFDGKQWSQSELRAPSDQRVSQGMPAPLGLDTTTPANSVAIEVQVEDKFDVPWLPLPYPATAVEVKGDWRYEEGTRTVFSSRTSTRGISYRASGLSPQPTAAQLRSAGVDGVSSAYTELPIGDGQIPQEIVALTNQVTKGAKTPYDQAVLLQAYFQSSQFTYSTDIEDGNGNDALRRFLKDKRGYCEQFASAMAAMARILGIPARVDIGFTPGTKDGQVQVVTVHDAHAWPELWFQGVGWLPFEPTPRSDGQVTQPSYSVKAAPGPQGPQPSAAPSAAPTSTATRGPKSNLEDINPERLGSNSSGSSGPSMLVIALLALLVLAALLAVPGLARVVVRRRRWARAETPASAAHAAWAELHASVRDLGIDWSASETPRAVARALARGLEGDPSAATAVRRLGAAEERARYARWTEDSTGPTAEQLRPDTVEVAAALRAQASRRARLRAMVLPRSVIAAGFHATTALIADALDGVDAVLAAFGRLARRAASPLARG
jgi:transglutaminase-like putative cysteine protease